MSDEREVEHEPQVLAGEDELPRQPSAQRDPYVPEPGPRPGERRAFRIMLLAVLVLAALLAVLIWLGLR